jgi:hypothetical protein
MICFLFCSFVNLLRSKKNPLRFLMGIELETAYQRKSENQTEKILESLLPNAVKVQLASFLLSSGYSIRDYYLFEEIQQLLKSEFENIYNNLPEVKK